MAKRTKAKAKRTPKQVVPCHCAYNKQISSLFDEVLHDTVNNDKQAEEYYTALCHSNSFSGMMETMLETDIDPMCVLSDAVRFGSELGRRMQEIKSLEEMVSYKGA